MLTSEAKSRHILLISSSVVYGYGYLDVAETEIRALLGAVPRVLFVPYAIQDRDGYAAKVGQRFQAMGYDVESIHQAPDPAAAVAKAQAIFVGGGNTFRLLKALYDNRVLAPIRQRIDQGIPYIGSSAGSNVAGPTIKTTKDMPIVYPPSFDALGLVSFQISPHFQDADPNSRHMGETQEQRIVEFLEENDLTVVAMREGAMVRIENGAVTLKGISGARIFRRGRDPVEHKPGDVLTEAQP